MTSQRLPNRWLLAEGGVLMQLALGAVYAWSVCLFYGRSLDESRGSAYPRTVGIAARSLLRLGRGVGQPFERATLGPLSI